MLHRALQQFLADVYWGDLDVLLLDLPLVRVTWRSRSPSCRQREIIVVTTPQPAAAEVAERAGGIALQTHQRLVGVVENMSAPVAPAASAWRSSALAEVPRSPRRCLGSLEPRYRCPGTDPFGYAGPGGGRRRRAHRSHGSRGTRGRRPRHDRRPPRGPPRVSRRQAPRPSPLTALATVVDARDPTRQDLRDHGPKTGESPRSCGAGHDRPKCAAKVNGSGRVLVVGVGVAVPA